MGAVAQLRIERDAGEGEGPETFTRRVQLLAGTEESARSDGIVYYSFPAAVRGIIRESSQYARLQKQVMFAFSSKYALALYEMVQKRGNLKFKTSEEFPVDRFRALLGVEDGQAAGVQELQAARHRSGRAGGERPRRVRLQGRAVGLCRAQGDGGAAVLVGEKSRRTQESRSTSCVSAGSAAVPGLRARSSRSPRCPDCRCTPPQDVAVAVPGARAAPPTPRCCRQIDEADGRNGEGVRPTPRRCR